MKLTRSRSWSEGPKITTSKTTLFACETCVDLFIKANGRKPDDHERASMPQEKRGHECVRCRRAWAFRSAGLDVPADYPTMTEALWSAGL